MIPARLHATSPISRKILFLILIAGISLFDQFRNAFSSRSSIPKMKAARDIRGLIRLLSHKDPDIQYEAAGALGDIGDPRAVDPLITALKNDEFSGVRWKAAESLSRIGPPAVDALIGALQHSDDDVRWKAAIALGEIGDQRAIEPLIRALTDKYENVRAEAATSLAAMGKDALEPLLRFLQYSDKSLRIDVVPALGELQDTDAIHPLIQMLENADEEERRAIADALDAILIPSVEPLVQKLRNGNTRKDKRNVPDNNEGEG
jgi:HEAT repeat protein